MWQIRPLQPFHLIVMSTIGQNKETHRKWIIFVYNSHRGQKNIFFGNKVRRRKKSSSLRIQKHVQSPSKKKKKKHVQSQVNCDRKHHETYDSQKILSL